MLMMRILLCTEIGFVQSKLGISTGWGGGSRLVKIIGKRKALQLLATAAILKYSTASQYGLVDGELQDNKVRYASISEYFNEIFCKDL